MNIKALEKSVVEELENMKAADITVLDVHELTSITDTMIVCTGRSSRHVQSIASAIAELGRKSKHPYLSTSGEELGDWVLVDLADLVVHVMQAETRDFYQLEELWSYAD